ncbi:MAG: molecular chaperone DjiA [Pseudomonadota bacterium]
MSIWSRLAEAFAALRSGAPLSEVFEKATTAPEHRVAFTIAVIALGAKMAKADGTVTRDEIAAFRQIFSIPPEAEAEAARLYNLARTEVTGYDVYARRIARMFRERPEVLGDLLEGLVFIAMADGEYHPGEAAFLEEVAQIFRIDSAEFRAIRARHLPGEMDPYAVLGLPPGSDDQALRGAYRKLVRDLHPDQMIARGVPEEARRLAEQRLARINDAYDQIMAERA